MRHGRAAADALTGVGGLVCVVRRRRNGTAVPFDPCYETLW